MVKVPWDYPTIQTAIDAAEPADEILVAPGHYKENLTIRNSQVLRGIGGSPEEVQITPAKKRRDVIKLESETGIDVTIRNLAVAGNQRSNGISVAGKARVRLTNVHISKFFIGLSVGDSGQAIIEDSTVSDNKMWGISVLAAHVVVQRSLVASNEGAGVYLLGKSEVEIHDSRILRNEVGIVAYHSVLPEPAVRLWGDPSTLSFQFGGQVVGCGNAVPGLGVPDGNRLAFIPPYPGKPWPEEFLAEE